MTRIRPPAVAGMFYTADAAQLAREVDSMLAGANAADIRPKALIVPHAGHIYSGPIAATAWRTLENRPATRRIVLLGPVHRVPVYGLALPDAEAFATPLGIIPLDTDAMEIARALPQVVVSDAAHALEHSLEVQLPFLQRMVGKFMLVPFAAGDAAPEDVAEVLDALWDSDDTLLVISSDLSHYLPYEQAQAVDAATAEQILALRWPLRHEQACGATPINGLLAAAPAHHLSPHLLDLRNSGDTAGDRDRVVGYGAFAFEEVAA